MKKLLFLSVVVTITLSSASAQSAKSVNDELNKVDADIAKAKKEALAEVPKMNLNAKGKNNANVDTLEVAQSVKFIKISNMLIPTAAFTQSAPVFMSVDAWAAVLEIINSREYGKIPATTISQILQAISQQLPRKEN